MIWSRRRIAVTGWSRSTCTLWKYICKRIEKHIDLDRAVSSHILLVLADSANNTQLARGLYLVVYTKLNHKHQKYVNSGLLPFVQLSFIIYERNFCIIKRTQPYPTSFSTHPKNICSLYNRRFVFFLDDWRFVLLYAYSINGASSQGQLQLVHCHDSQLARGAHMGPPEHAWSHYFGHRCNDQLDLARCLHARLIPAQNVSQALTYTIACKP
jgi:hypothetical protein